MSILIKGMKMPETCEKCDFCIWSNYRQTGWCVREQRQCFDDYSVEYREKRAKFCPMSELPPHGRLIDAWEFEVVSYKGIPDGYKDTFDDGVLWMCEKIDDAPTIIPADKGETE